MQENNKLRVPVHKQYVNSILAEDVYKDKELKLLSKGEVLTERRILALQKHNINFMYIIAEEDNSEE
ncbi:hypothetical protein PP175_26135 (plasmid) [Aneurinibacillus sp. Ricciae_BoGa-3]|uniref:hypothetical protein n=1 Tax=Aneurinibacillus sp. Ricciae_BoGa-3 TaxID=3022697 RepID=UPI002340CC6E|nr:hypothetical protein [Aneurinibacillus sp. Ricciae_BoGa-3]WCK57547.1 hypothetical protein PP175_26135 [Aneurinibacillus sp. Ricciae_BoGa-3]